MFNSSFEVKPKYIERVEHLAMMCSTDIEDDIAELLKDKGWDNTLYHKFSSQVYHTISKYILNYSQAKQCEQELKHMLRQKKRNSKPFLNMLNTGSFNFFDIILQDNKLTFFKNIELLKAIYKIRLDGVGLGEVFLTLFSECKTPIRGDIITGDFLIELKGEKGQIGIDGYWNDCLSFLKQKYQTTSNTIALKCLYNDTPQFIHSQLIELRTEKCDEQYINQLNLEINDIINTVKDIDYKKFVLAVQIYTYHYNNKFDKIIFINKDKALCISYTTLSDIYYQILPHTFSLQVVSQPARNKGYGIVFKS